MPVKKYSDSPGNTEHYIFNKWWRAKTGKKYKDSPAAAKRKHEKRKESNRYERPGRPRTGDMGRPAGGTCEHPRYPRTCGFRAPAGAGHNQKVAANIVIDYSSPTITRLDAVMAEIDRRYRGGI